MESVDVYALNSPGSGYVWVWLSWTRSWSFWFHQRRGISFPAELRWASPGVLWFVLQLREFGRLCWLFTSFSGLFGARTILEIDYYLSLNTLRTGDADLRFYITTVQDGWRKSAFLTRACFLCTIHLIMQYIEPVSEWFCWRMFIESWPHSELTFRHRASSI